MIGQEDENLGICVVGAGDIGTIYLNAWQGADAARVVSVSDINEDRARAGVEEHEGASWHTDYREAVAAEGVDIVNVCTPTMLHPEVTIHAAEHGKHVLCVKPIALRLDDADQMIKVAEESGVQFSVGFMRRYTPATAIVHEWVTAGSLGRPVFYSVNASGCIRPKILMHDVDANGGPVIDMCCHWFDIARVYFDSEPVRVMAQGMTFATGRPELESIGEKAVDTAAIIVMFESGDVLSIDISWGLPPNQESSHTEQIWGPRGQVRDLGFDSSRTVVCTELARETIEVEQSPTFQDSTDLLVEDFLRAVQGEAELAVTGGDGRIALEVSLAALRSIKTGEFVELNSRSGDQRTTRTEDKATSTKEDTEPCHRCS